MLLSNVGMLPATSHCYTFVMRWLVPLSVPLLLFDADLMKVVKRSGGWMLGVRVLGVRVTSLNWP